jgi:hypothetical protein
LEEKFNKEKISIISSYNINLIELAKEWLENTEHFVNNMTVFKEN